MTADAHSSVTVKSQVAIAVRTVAWLFAASHGLQLCCSSLPGGFLGYLSKHDSTRIAILLSHPTPSYPLPIS